MIKKTSQKPKRTSTGRVTARKVQETNEHAKLKATLKEIMRSGGLKLDTEVALNFSGSHDDKGKLIVERSIDVAAFGNVNQKSFLLIFECKSGSNFDEINKKISSWEADIEKMRKGEARVISSDENSIEESDLEKFEYFRVCHVFGNNVDSGIYDKFALALTRRNFYAWDSNALTYYKRTAGTVGKRVKYELLREFGVNLESSALFHEQAIRIKQNGTEMFLLGVKPSVLLKIGYVFRRASGKPHAYQRILNKDRIEKISEFLRSQGALLPNAIIIAFDDEPDIQKEVSHKDGRLYFPSAYCSAWIIDGQHRVFGFMNTRFEEMDDDDSEEVFKLPVVAFKNLDGILQNRAFVNINYHQKKIDPTLLCDLATDLRDLDNELTWPSLLVAELNKVEPLKGKVKISELDMGKPISNSSFARYGLLEGLLAYDKKKRSFGGALSAYSPFKPRASLDNPVNQESLKRQVDLLRRYFDAVAQNTSNADPKKNPWHNTDKYSLLKATGINALLLVLSRIMEKYPNVEDDIHKDLRTYLKPLRKVNFAREFVVKQGGGWKGFRKLANVILRKLNAAHNDSLRLFGEKEKK